MANFDTRFIGEKGECSRNDTGYQGSKGHKGPPGPEGPPGKA